MPRCSSCNASFWTFGGLEKHTNDIHGYDVSITTGQSSYDTKYDTSSTSYEDQREYNEFNRPSVPYEQIQTANGVRTYVRQLRAQGWDDSEIRTAFDGSRIDIDRYL
jgi:hypothetical protein